jgi:beta-galactosidase
VPYQAGVLHAVGFSGGRATSFADLKSAGQPSAIKLTPDRVRIVADNQDLSYVTVELVDAKGVRNPTAENSIRFAIEGPGKIVAVANANPISTESYQRAQRKAWQGRSLVIVKSTQQAGPITITALSSGLRSAKVVLSSRRSF